MPVTSTRSKASFVARRLEVFAAVLAFSLAVACTGDIQPVPATTAAQPQTGQTDAAAAPDPAPRSDETAGEGVGKEMASAKLAYRRFWAVSMTIGRRAPAEWRTILATVAAEPLLSQLVDGLAAQRRNGTVDYGTVVLRPTVAELLPTRASVVDCQDASRSGEVERATGVVKSVGSSRTSVAAVLRKNASGSWRVTEARYLPDPC